MGDDRHRLPDGTIPGAGLAYSQVLEALVALCDSRTIDASIELERPELSDVEGPLEQPGRPETDLED
jgi:hypothetical protein